MESEISNITQEKLRIKGKDQGNLEINIHKQPILRFAPEPSGYLHLGHAKAFFLNHHFSKDFFRVRIDDTNPLKETLEYENSIKKDLLMISSKRLFFSRSSDYFNALIFYAHKFIELGYAYADNTPVEQMRDERDKGIENENRNNSVEKNKEIFVSMLNQKNKEYCLRAKIDIKHKNKSLRDPVIFRFNFVHHYIYGDKYFVYPTYDFACPIIDSIECITNVFRSNEYRDRNAQYNWFIKKLKTVTFNKCELSEYIKEEKKENSKIIEDFLFFKNNCNELIHESNFNIYKKENILSLFNFLDEKITNHNNSDKITNNDFNDELIIFNYYLPKFAPEIVDFSRMSFENTILSKRNLKEIISDNKLTWDDPRIPTIRGIIRKGLNIEALKEYVLMQGVAQKNSVFSWDKLWSINKKVIDDLSGRYFCIEEKDLVEFVISDVTLNYYKSVPLHRKNPSLGEKSLFYGDIIYLNKNDVNLIKDSEFTLMYFSCAKIIGNKIFLTDSDVRKSKHKIHWVPKQNSVRIKLINYTDLLREDKFNHESKEEEWGVAEEEVLKAKGVVQFERMGYYYVDQKGIFNLVPYTVQVKKY
ncbi:hypothetical protein H312_00775 [Anncaliia algerae PRA339]|uniref:Probable glutamate--tRNA ligase, cytoplasmic n=1 Tax=Anncaliia algerae PRA339 TaxID=1288291 RepID=A0A059F449_9MICR|nr:hypothetical protein H312_00775 [Anncaliia algerae PRA339]